MATLSQHGLELIQDVDALTRFMRQYGDKIAAHTLETYMPLYDLKPTEVELAILEGLGKARKAQPGRLRRFVEQPSIMISIIRDVAQLPVALQV